MDNLVPKNNVEDNKERHLALNTDLHIGVYNFTNIFTHAQNHLRKRHWGVFTVNYKTKSNPKIPYNALSKFDFVLFHIQDYTGEHFAHHMQAGKPYIHMYYLNKI